MNNNDKLISIETLKLVVDELMIRYFGNTMPEQELDSLYKRTMFLEKENSIGNLSKYYTTVPNLIPDGTDLNTLFKPGNYFYPGVPNVGGILNVPNNIKGFFLMILNNNHADVRETVQIYRSIQDGQTIIRACNESGVFSQWRNEYTRQISGPTATAAITEIVNASNNVVLAGIGYKPVYGENAIKISPTGDYLTNDNVGLTVKSNKLIQQGNIEADGGQYVRLAETVESNTGVLDVVNPVDQSIIAGMSVQNVDGEVQLKVGVTPDYQTNNDIGLIVGVDEMIFNGAITATDKFMNEITDPLAVNTILEITNTTTGTAAGGIALKPVAGVTELKIGLGSDYLTNDNTGLHITPSQMSFDGGITSSTGDIRTLNGEVAVESDSEEGSGVVVRNPKPMVSLEVANSIESVHLVAEGSTGKFVRTDINGSNIFSWDATSAIFDGTATGHYTKAETDTMYADYAIDNLTSTSATNALSANMGRVLQNTKEDKGIVSGQVTLLTTEDLNTLFVSTHHYRQPVPTNATLVRNYPVEGKAGYVEVKFTDAGLGGVTQVFTIPETNSIYVRSYYNGSWGAWENLVKPGELHTGLDLKADKVTTIATGAGLAGGGDLSANRTLSIVPATTTTIGGIKVGTDLVIQPDGTLSAVDMRYTLPPATPAVIGGVRPGAGLVVDQNGILTVHGDGGYSSGVVFELTVENLNSLNSESRSYRQGQTNESLLGLNYPVPEAGYLDVKYIHALDGGGVVQVYYTRDTNKQYVRTLHGGIWSPWQASLNGGDLYVLPKASATVLGGIKVGANLTIAGDGTLSTNDPFILEPATDMMLGGIIVGNNLSVDANGRLSALAPSDSTSKSYVDAQDALKLDKGSYVGTAADLNAAIITKAEKTYTDSQLALKANITYVDSSVAPKADKTYVDNKLATKSDLSYVDTELAEKADIVYVDAQDTLKADKTYVDSQLALKADVAVVNNKADRSYVDAVDATKADITYVDAEVSPKADKTYVDTIVSTKADQMYVDTQLALKADKTYTDSQLALKTDKTYTDSQLALKANTSDMNTALALKADLTYVDAELATKADSVEIDAELALKADKTYVDAQDATKANLAYVDSELALKANDAEVDAALALKANTTYVDAGLAPKAEYTYVDLAVAPKADKTYVDAQDALKANITDVDADLALKADITYVDTELAAKASQDYVEGELVEKADITYVDSQDALKLDKAGYIGTAADLNTAIGTKADKSYVDIELATKAEIDTVDAALALKADLTYVDAELATKADSVEIDAELALKADKTYVDTQDALKADKTYVDTQLATKANTTYVDTELALKADQASVDAELALKANTTDVDADLALKANIVDVDADLALKADLAYVDTELALKADIATVDSNLALKADTTYVDSQDALKADLAYVDTELALKADKSYTDTQLGLKADTTYVDTKDATKLDKGSYTGTASDLETAINTKADNSVQVLPGNGLTGGGDLTADVTLTLLPATATTLGGIIPGNGLVIDQEGRVEVHGDGGYSSGEVHELTVEDLDSLNTESRSFRQSQSNESLLGLNYPVPEAGYLDVKYIHAVDGGGVVQLYYTRDTNRQFTRALHGGIWHEWKEAAYGVEGYVLPEATPTTLGGVMVGSTLTVDASGLINVDTTELDPIYYSKQGGEIEGESWAKPSTAPYHLNGSWHLGSLVDGAGGLIVLGEFDTNAKTGFVGRIFISRDAISEYNDTNVIDIEATCILTSTVLRTHFSTVPDLRFVTFAYQGKTCFGLQLPNLSFGFVNLTGTRLAGASGYPVLIPEPEASVSTEMVVTEIGSAVPMIYSILNKPSAEDIDTYTKAQSDAKFELIDTAYSKAESDSKYEVLGTAYSKAESDAQLATKAESDDVEIALSYKADQTYVDSQLSLKSDQVYVDAQLDTKADKTVVDLKADKSYVDIELATKAEIDTVDAALALKADLNYVNYELALKADQTDVDLKADKTYVDGELTKKADAMYVDTELAEKADIDYVDYMVGTKTDTAYVDAAVAPKADKSYVDAELALKADYDIVDAELDMKADQVYVDGELATKADTTYVDAELLLKANTADVDADLALKADTTYVDAQVATKTDTAYVDAAVAPKANTVDVDADLALKADLTYVDASVAPKADTVYVDTQLATKANIVDMEADLALKADLAHVDSIDATKADKSTTITAGTGLIGGGDLSDNRNIELAIATADTLGGVIIGDNLFIDSNGRLSSTGGGTLPPATTDTIGGIIVGNSLIIDALGKLDVVGDGGYSTGTVFELTTEDLNTLITETRHFRQPDPAAALLALNYPTQEAGYLETKFINSDNGGGAIQIYFTRDTNMQFTRTYSNGVFCAWIENDLDNPGDEDYILPPATAETLGGIKVGFDKQIDATGVLTEHDANFFVRSKPLLVPTFNGGILVDTKIPTNLDVMIYGTIKVHTYKSGVPCFVDFQIFNNGTAGSFNSPSAISNGSTEIKELYFMNYKGTVHIWYSYESVGVFSLGGEINPLADEFDDNLSHVVEIHNSFGASVAIPVLTAEEYPALDTSWDTDCAVIAPAIGNFAPKDKVEGQVKVLDGEHLNGLFGETIHYRQPDSAKATLDLGYPVPAAGYLEVIATGALEGAGSGTIQRYTVYDTGITYTRYYKDSIWSTWIEFVLGHASATNLGGIKVGANLSIDANGVLSAVDSYVLPTASDTVLGGVKVGNNLMIDGDGILHSLAPADSATITYVDTQVATKLDKGGYVGTADDLNTEINTKADQVYVDTQLDLKADLSYVNTELDTKANWEDMDILLAEKADITYVDAQVAPKADKTYVDSIVAPKADKTYVDAELALKANDAEVDAALALKADQVYVDNQLALKADRSYVDAGLATKTDEAYVDAAVAPKADTVYVDSELDLKADLSYVDAELALKANDAEVDMALALKANTEDVNLALSYKADQLYVDNQLALKADQVYVDVQLDTKADTTYVDSQDALKLDKGTYVGTASDLEAAINTKADSAYMDLALDEKADITYVDAQVAPKADQSYVDSRLALKADSSVVAIELATKAEITSVDAALAFKADITYVDAELATKAETTLVDTKADKTYVDAELALKADQDYVDLGLSEKADIIYVDSGLATKTDTAYVDAAVAPKADKSYVDAELALKANDAEVDAAIALKADITYVDGLVAPKADTVYVDAQLATKADSDYMELALDEKADITYVDTGLAAKTDTVYVDAAVAPKADKTYVDAQLATKANDAEVDAAIALKADITYVDSELALKANDAEVDAALVAKADITYVDAGLVTKADRTYVDEELANKADQYEVDLKADQIYVDAELALKAEYTYVDTAVAPKADKSYVDTKLATKAEISAVDTALVFKADITYVDAQDNYKANKSTTIATGTGLIGGGDLSADRTIELQVATVTDLGGIKVGDNLTIDAEGRLNAEAYTLPIASTTVLGGIKPGANTTMKPDGTLDVSFDAIEEYVLPIASDVVLGGIKVGSNLAIDVDGTLNSLAPADSATITYVDSQVATKLDKGGYNGSAADLNADIIMKADKIYVDAELAEKASITYVDDSLIYKADKTYVDNQLAAKADITYVDTELNVKADRSYVDAMVAPKADTTYVDAQVATKTDTAYVDAQVAPKADQLYVDNQLSFKADITYVDLELANKADKSYVDAGLAAKADITMVETKADKSYVDTSLASKADITYVDSKLALKADITLVNTKADTTYVNSQLALKADSADVAIELASKAEITSVDTALSFKADITYVDAGLATKTDTAYVDAAVAPKANTADVNLALSYKADQSYVDEQLALKADQVYIDAQLDTKAEYTYVDAAVAPKADKTYVDAELATKASIDETNLALSYKADQVYVDSQLALKSDQVYVDAQLDTKADKTISITAGTGLIGGGDLSDNREVSLAIATPTTLGGVQIGSGLDIDVNGVVTADGKMNVPYTRDFLPVGITNVLTQTLSDFVIAMAPQSRATICIEADETGWHASYYPSGAYNTKKSTTLEIVRQGNFVSIVAWTGYNTKTYAVVETTHYNRPEFSNKTIYINGDNTVVDRGWNSSVQKVDLTGQAQLGNMVKSYVALGTLVESETTSEQEQSMVNGELVFHRKRDGDFMGRVEFFAQKQWTTADASIWLNTIHSTQTVFNTKACTFTKDGIRYYGFEISGMIFALETIVGSYIGNYEIWACDANHGVSGVVYNGIDLAIMSAIEVLTTEDLNTLKLQSEEYRQTSDANATLARNYPVQKAGYLEVKFVSPGTGGVIQVYTVKDTGAVYIRRFVGNSWYPWVEQATVSYVDTQDALKLDKGTYVGTADDLYNEIITKAETEYVDFELATKADITYVDAELATKANIIDVDADLALKADQIYVDSELALKADQIVVDTKAEYTYVDAAVAPKADTAYVDSQLALKANDAEVDAAIALKADLTYVDAELDTKANQDDMEIELDLKADIAYVDSSVAVKADKTTTISAGNGLSGGGDLSSNRTLDLKPATATTLGGVTVGANIAVDASGVISVATPYVLPPATVSTIGGIKPGANTFIREDGTLDVSLDAVSDYVLPIASAITLGGIKVGNNLYIEVDGTLNATAGMTKTYIDAQDALKLDKGSYTGTADDLVMTINTKADKSYVDTELSTKAEITYVDSAVAPKADKSYVDGELGLKADQADMDIALDTKANIVDVDADLALKADTIYVDSELALKADQIYVDTQLGLKTDKTYTDSQLALKADKTYVDTNLALKANSADVAIELATKAEIDSVDAALALKADLTYVDTELLLKADQSTMDAELALKADEAEMVTGLALKADIIYVDQGLALKANADETTAALNLKADLNYVDSELALKANTTDMNAALALKADITLVNTKADITYVDSKDALKADITYVDSKDALKLDKGTYVGTADDIMIAVGLKADKTYVDTELALKVDSEYMELALDEKADITYVDAGLATKTDTAYVDAAVAPKADKSYVDTQLALKADITYVDISVDAKADTVYVDAELALKANIVDVDADLALKANIVDVDADLALKADLTYVDTQLATKANTADVDAELALKADITLVDTKADKTYVDTELALKADITYVDTAVAPKADKSYVDTQLALKVDTEYMELALDEKSDLTYVDAQLATKANTSDVNTSLALKADITYVDAGLATKTDTAYVDAAVAPKADKSYVDSQLALKVDTDYMELALEEKADITYVDSQDALKLNKGSYAGTADDIMIAVGTKADKAITISTGTGLSGGGDLSTNRTLTLIPATPSVLGGVMPGVGLVVDQYGTINVQGDGGYSSGEVHELTIEDLDTLASESRSFRQSQSTDALLTLHYPVEEAGYLDVKYIHALDGGGVVQVYYTRDTNRQFTRSLHDGAWGIWKEVTFDLQEYNLPVATPTVLGGVKVGSNLTVDGTGLLDVNMTSMNNTYYSKLGGEIGGDFWSKAGSTPYHTNGAWYLGSLTAGKGSVIVLGEYNINAKLGFVGRIYISRDQSSSYNDSNVIDIEATSINTSAILRVHFSTIGGIKFVTFDYNGKTCFGLKLPDISFGYVNLSGTRLAPRTGYPALAIDDGSMIFTDLVPGTQSMYSIYNKPTAADVNAYSKSESDARYEPFDSTYTKVEADARFEPVDSSYDKTEADGRFAKLVGANTFSGGNIIFNDGTTFNANIHVNGDQVFKNTSTLKVDGYFTRRLDDIGTNNVSVMDIYNLTASQNYGGIGIKKYNGVDSMVLGMTSDYLTSPTTGAFFNNLGLKVNGEIVATSNIISSSSAQLSDRRIKTDIVKLDDSKAFLDKVSKLDIYSYTNTLTKEADTGVIAQEVEEALDGKFVKNIKSGMIDEDIKEVLTVDYAKLSTAISINLVKELNKANSRIEKLEEICKAKDSLKRNSLILSGLVGAAAVVTLGLLIKLVM